MKNRMSRTLREQYKVAEHFAHDLAYIDHKEETLVEEGVEYKVTKIASCDGFTCYIFKPITPGHTDIKITFRGASDFASFLALIQSKGPGHETFEKMRPTILKAVNRTIAEVSQANSTHPIKVSAYGHSLGGGLAQYFTVAMLREILNIKDSPYQHFRKVAHLHARPFSSVGVDKATALESLKLGDELYERKRKMKKNSQQVLPHLDIRWLIGAGDGFQRTGDDSIFSNVLPEIADVSLVKAHHKEGGEGIWNTFANFSQFYKALLNAFKVHTGFYFSEQHHRERLEYYTNKNQRDREHIHQELSNKSTPLKSALLKAPQHILHKMIQGVYQFGRGVHQLKQKVKEEVPRLSSQVSTLTRHGFFTKGVAFVKKTAGMNPGWNLNFLKN